MVGFFRESSNQEEESGVSQQKLKISNFPENFRFDFEGYSSEFGGFSVASAEPFLDFDSIKDWIEEMQVPDSVEKNKAEIRSGICVESCLENQISDSLFDFDHGMKEKSMSVKAEYSGYGENMDSKGDVVEDDSLVELDGMKETSMKKAEMGSSETGEIKLDGHHGKTKTSLGDESGIGVLGGGTFHKAESLGCSIEEGLEKVTLVGDEGGKVVAGTDMTKGDTVVVNDDSVSDSDSDSESECETSSPSSSTSSSSSGSDDDEEEEVKGKETLCKIKREITKQKADMEEGQIMDSDGEKNEDEGEDDDDAISNKYGEEFQFLDDADCDEDGDVVKGPIKSKNELKVLPPVPAINVTLQSCHEILPVGVVSSVLGAQVVVEGSEKHDPLSEGSILWVADSRLPLGLVDEIFGPVKTPFYIVRHNSESEVPSGVQNGTLVGFVSEFVGHVLTDKNLYQKGYDASGDNDEEVLDEFDFSDDEKEAEYKRMLKMSKRGNNNQGLGSGNKKNRKNNRGRDKTWTKDQPSPSQYQTLQSSQSSQMQQHKPRVPPSSEDNQLGPSPIGQFFPGGSALCPSSQGNQLGPSQMRPFFPNGPMAFPHQMQQAGFLLNGLFANGIPFQPQNMALSGGFQMNSMPWLQQSHPQNFQVPSAGPAPWQQQQQPHVSQVPLSNPAQCQQPFDLSQLVAGAAATAFGPVNFSAGPTNAPLLGVFGQNLSNQALQSPRLVGQTISNQVPLSLGLQAPNSKLPAMQGQSFNSRLPTNFHGNDGASPQFSRGLSSGRGRGRRSFHRSGGHSGGGRGRQ